MRLIRILKFERGNALLIGMGGSGRKSLTRLASFIRKYQCFEIEISKSYGVREFYEDLGTLLKIAGSEQQDISFLFTDTQIITDQFLEAINNILNTGSVPNLYESEEMQMIIDEVRPKAKNDGIEDTRDAIS